MDVAGVDDPSKQESREREAFTNGLVIYIRLFPIGSPNLKVRRG